jgi:hypothetical protein
MFGNPSVEIGTELGAIEQKNGPMAAKPSTEPI